MSLEDLTVGELRLALRRGSPEQTVPEALATIAEQDEVDHRHALAQERYKTYMAMRRERCARAEREAMDEIDRERQQTGQPWPTDEARPRARRQAGLEAQERFDLDEPLLEFADWLAAESPSAAAH
jgi:hypothetical protein